MNTLLNIIWHIPFLGFIYAGIYALCGLILCLTIIGMPLGLGLLQMGRFLLCPFGNALVSRGDLARLKGENLNILVVTYSCLLRIVYFPIGLILSILFLFSIVSDFLSIIGIPCALVWAKSLPAIFDPIDKICVPGEISDEINRRKTLGTL